MSREHKQLTKEIITPGRRRGARRAWVVALVLVLAVNFAAVPLRPLDGHIKMIDHRWSTLLDSTHSWLILGDSSGLHGVVARQVADSLDTDAVNVCLFGTMTLLSDAWMLKSYVEEHGAPEGVILVHVYDVTERDIGVAATAWTPLPWGYWSELTPAYQPSLRREFDVFAARDLPLFTEPGLLRKVALSTMGLDTLDQLPYMADGWVPITEPDTAGVRRDIQEHLRFVRKHTYALSKDARIALETIRDLADQYDFPVYFAPSPLVQDLAQNPLFAAHYGAFRDTMTDFCATSPNLHFVLNRPVTFPIGWMQLADHVVAAGAREYTAELMQDVLALRER